MFSELSKVSHTLHMNSKIIIILWFGSKLGKVRIRWNLIEVRRTHLALICANFGQSSRLCGSGEDCHHLFCFGVCFAASRLVSNSVGGIAVRPNPASSGSAPSLKLFYTVGVRSHVSPRHCSLPQRVARFAPYFSQ